MATICDGHGMPLLPDVAVRGRVAAVRLSDFRAFAAEIRNCLRAFNLAVTRLRGIEKIFSITAFPRFGGCGSGYSAH